MPPRRLPRVALVVFDGVQSLDVTGPAEVFDIAGRLAGRPYAVEVVASEARPLTSSSGLRLVPDRALRSCRGGLDTVVVAGGTGVRAAERDEVLLRWLSGAAGRSRRVASVCTGAFLLARAGLLDGRRATTHWSACEALERRYPAVAVERDRIFVRDGEVWTSAGITAGMDLALALIEDDLGPETALGVARQLVLFSRRPGGQSQFSAQLSAEPARQEPVRRLQGWVHDHLDDDLSVEALAARACMSPRNLARVFAREVGVTPAAYVESVRVEAARALLEAGDAPVDAVARRCGFGTADTMRRAFRRRLGVTPVEYRERFRPALEAA